jgi:outer membrane protein OmpA-like peptidoglycan-associated protein
MRHYLSAFLIGAGLFVSSQSSAQNLSLRVEPGVAVPLTNPQAQVFDTGVAVALKPELTLAHYVGVGPAIQYLYLPTNNKAVADDGAAWSLGGFVRVKRPHDEVNTGREWSAVSPWVDADLKLVHTGSLDRLGASIGVGAQVPTDNSRWLWVGPFVRYDVVNQDDGKSGVNTNSAKTLIAGFSFEFSAPAKHEAAPADHSTYPTQTPTHVSTLKPAIVYEDTAIQMREVIQFQVNSSRLDGVAVQKLNDVVSVLKNCKSYDAVHIQGHASVDGIEEKNIPLSLNRATAVRDYLVAHRIDGAKVFVDHYGSKVPSTNVHADRHLNRRAELFVNIVAVKGVK